MSFLEALYREAVLDHARKPRNRGRLEQPTVRQEGINPSCGDELEVDVLIDGDTLVAATFTGQGCAISQASASMMTEVVRSRSLTEVTVLIERFKDMIHGRGAHPSLGDAAVLEGVAKLHARVKCATLAWVTLQAALKRVESAAEEVAREAAARASTAQAREGSSSPSPLSGSPIDPAPPVSTEDDDARPGPT
jgi:nitrogen fixation protein NifU and related proteins